MRKPIVLIAIAAALGAAAPATAGARKPPLTLPLKAGVYMPVDMPCANPPVTFIANFRGGRGGIGVGPQVCKLTALSQSGPIYSYSDVCTDTDSGQSTPSQGTVIVHGPSRFTLDSTTYRYCGGR